MAVGLHNQENAKRADHVPPVLIFEIWNDSIALDTMIASCKVCPTSNFTTMQNKVGTPCDRLKYTSKILTRAMFHAIKIRHIEKGVPCFATVSQKLCFHGHIMTFI
jgi:hypothetical protein